MTTNSRAAISRAAAASLVAVTMFGGCDGGDDASSSPDMFTIERGDMRITVRELGEIKALREERVRSAVEGQATIIYLVPEGERVEKGQKIVELDASALKDREANQAIAVGRAKASLVNAEQNVEILGKELRSLEASANSVLEIAKINLEKYLGGLPPRSEQPDGGGAIRLEGTNREMLERLRELVADTKQAKLTDAVVQLLGPENLDRDMGDMAQKVLDQIDKIRLARADLKLKEDTLEHSTRLAAKDYITRNELDRHQLDFDGQSSRVTLAWNELNLLVNYGLRSEKIDLELKVDNAILDVEKTISSNEARRAREKEELRSSQSEFDLAQGRLDNLRLQIKNAVMYAPSPGLVVYASDGDGRRGNSEVVEEGVSVRERQSLIILPDVSTMIAEVKVPESDIDKVVIGQDALVRVDAFPDQAFPAKVTRVSPLPDSGSRWSNNNKKVYKTDVTLAGVNEVLRPGMSSTVEILVGRVVDVISVPIPGVRRQGAVHYAWVATARGPIAREVTVGRSNVSHVEILDGLSVGDAIFLSVPTGANVPEFQQPERADEPEAPPAAAREPATEPETDSETPRRGRGERRAGGGTAFLDQVKAQLPQFADRLEADGFRALRDEDIRAAIEANDVLRAAGEKMRTGARRRGNAEGGESDGGTPEAGKPEDGSTSERGGKRTSPQTDVR